MSKFLTELRALYSRYPKESAEYESDYDAMRALADQLAQELAEAQNMVATLLDYEGAEGIDEPVRLAAYRILGVRHGSAVPPDADRGKEQGDQHSLVPEGRLCEGCKALLYDARAVKPRGLDERHDRRD